MEQIVADVRNAFKNLKQVFSKMWNGVKQVLFKLYSNNYEFRKLFIMYRKTKKKRIRNKYYKKMIRFINSYPIFN